MHLHCIPFTAEMKLTIYILRTVFQKYVNGVNCQNKLHLDYDEPLDQYNKVRGRCTIFHRKFHLLEYWMAAWSNLGVKYI